MPCSPYRGQGACSRKSRRFLRSASPASAGPLLSRRDYRIRVIGAAGRDAAECSFRVVGVPRRRADGVLLSPGRSTPPSANSAVGLRRLSLHAQGGGFAAAGRAARGSLRSPCSPATRSSGSTGAGENASTSNSATAAGPPGGSEVATPPPGCQPARFARGRDWRPLTAGSGSALGQGRRAGQGLPTGGRPLDSERQLRVACRGTLAARGVISTGRPRPPECASSARRRATDGRAWAPDLFIK